MEPLLNLQQAAELLGLSRSQLYNLTRRRTRARADLPVPCVKLGKRRMFRATSLHRWIEALEQSSEKV